MLRAQLPCIGHDGVHFADDRGQSADHLHTEIAFAAKSEARISYERAQSLVDAADFGLQRFHYLGTCDSACCQAWRIELYISMSFCSVSRLASTLTLRIMPRVTS